MKQNADRSELSRVLLEAEHVAIVSHVRPDGDTLGANCALAEALRKLGKTVSQFCEDSVPEKFSYLPGFSSFGIRQSETFDCAVAVDCGDLLRLGSYGKLFGKTRQTLNIDHHISNDYYAKLNYVQYYASCCEVILELISDWEVEITPEIATCLYTGLSTDTGNFMHSNTTKREFLAAAQLSERIPDLGALNTILYKEMPKARFDLLCAVLPTIRFEHANRLAILTVRREVLERTGAEFSFTEGFVDYAINIAGVEVGVCILEQSEHQFKISFRSKRSNVCRLAERFGGGGHIHAAGCRICGFYEDAVDKIVRETGILFEEEEEDLRKAAQKEVASVSGKEK